MSCASSWIRASTRIAIYFRDGFRCVYCRSPEELTLDHLEGGRNHAPSNVVTCCHRCNSARGGLSLASWYATLRRRGVGGNVRLRVHRARRRPLNRDLGAFAAAILPHVPGALAVFREVRPRARQPAAR